MNSAIPLCPVVSFFSPCATVGSYPINCAVYIRIQSRPTLPTCWDQRCGCICNGTAHRVKTPPHRSILVIQSNVVLALSSPSPTSHTLLPVIRNRDSNCAKHTRNLRFIHSSCSKHAQTLTAPYSTCPIISEAVCQFVTLLTSLDQQSASWHSFQSSSVLAHIFQGRHNCTPIKLT